MAVIAGPAERQALTRGTACTSIGSAKQNDVVLADPAVSRHHLRIEIGDDGITLTDLGSTNGTRIGGLRINRVVVEDGNVDLRLGDSTLRLTPLAEAEAVVLPETDAFGELLGQSPAMGEMFQLLEAVAPRDVSILLEGETGTGKELIAQEIHRHSSRADRPYVVVDCASLPPTLVESELFGHARGAFTNATHARPGAFEEADGGTVFLDEIGELRLETQPRLLRVLERGEVKRLGENHYRKVNVRVIAATNRDLQRCVNQTTFRPDLYYRLAVVHVRVPPLRERVGDARFLAKRLLPELAKQLTSREPPELNAETIHRIQSYPWPGNVRELRNFLQRLVTLPAQVQEGPDLDDEQRPASPAPGPSEDTILDTPFSDAKGRLVDQFERDYLRRLLTACGGNVAEASRRGGIARGYLFRLIKKHSLRTDLERPPRH